MKSRYLPKTRLKKLNVLTEVDKFKMPFKRMIQTTFSQFIIIGRCSLPRIKKTTKKSIDIPKMTVQTCCTVVLLLLTFQLGCIKTSGQFDCYTGDGPIMRRKSCPVADFSDLCFKKVGDNGQGETMRGCFNSVIASLIFPSDNDKIEPGCYPIPRKLGIGTLCVCDSNLCNSAPSLRLGSTIMPSMNFPFSSILRYFIINKIYVGLLMVAVMFERIALR